MMHATRKKAKLKTINNIDSLPPVENNIKYFKMK